jgi:hypothetical protein
MHPGTVATSSTEGAATVGERTAVLTRRPRR